MQLPRKQRVQAVFDASTQLTLANPAYARQVDLFFRTLFNSDRQTRDASLRPARFYQRKVQAIIIAKSPAIVAGVAEIQHAMRQSGLTITTNCPDGEAIAAGAILMELSGTAATILTYERTILNLLQRLSGIATATHELCKLLAGFDTQLAATRKTLWGWLDKRAVALGGGLTHRLGLHDAAMLKENHLFVLQLGGEKTLPIALRRLTGSSIRFIEVEVKNAAEFYRVAELFQKLPPHPPHVIMFDHFDPVEINTLVTELKKRDWYDSILLEASGNVNAERLRQYATSGVDVISVGAITHSVPSADFSLLIASD